MDGAADEKSKDSTTEEPSTLDLHEKIRLAQYALNRWRNHHAYDEMQSEVLVLLMSRFIASGQVIIAVSRMCNRISREGLIRISYRTQQRRYVKLKRTGLKDVAAPGANSLEWRELIEKVDESEILNLWFQGYTDAEIGTLIGQSNSTVQRRRRELIEKLYEIYKDVG
jgi:DNA-binding NarL/FixJ family response regulator